MLVRWFVASSVALVTASCAEAFLAGNPAAVEGRGEYAGSSVLYVDNAIRSACDIDSPSALFGTDRTTVTDEGRKGLKDLAECVNSGGLAGYSLAIHGFADPRGSDGYNEALAQRRAEAVAAVLTENGVNGRRLKIISHGEDEARGEGVRGYAFDRRVQIELLDRHEVSQD